MSTNPYIGVDKKMSAHIFAGLSRADRHKYMGHIKKAVGADMRCQVHYHDIPILKRAVSNFTGFTWEEIIGGSQRGDLVEARHLFMAYACKLLNMSQELAAYHTNGKDHAIAYHAIKKVENTFHPTSKKYKRLVEFIETGNYGI
jgi:chromosomal replication initiation ATPase DnaA